MCPGYGAAWASFGAAVLEEENVVQAEFPAAEQSSSTPVALFGLVQWFSTGAAWAREAPTVNPLAKPPFSTEVGLLYEPSGEVALPPHGVG